MQTLHLHSSGADVVLLQEKLKALGFNPGRIDGDFGPGTEAAVIAFQKSEGLLADGVVGTKTLLALGFSPAPGAVRADSVLPHITVSSVSKLFPFTPLDNIKKHLPIVLNALKEKEIDDRNMVLMALATISAETASFKPIDEGKSRFNTSPGGRPFDLYDFRRDLGNQGPPDGERFKGRGFIQLTGRSNYKNIGNKLDIDLIEDPAVANKPTVAAQVLAVFLKDKELAIREALLENDLRQARRLVNGGSHGLDVFTTTYRTGENLLTQVIQVTLVKELH
ncbi:peptidoglycan-binding protein [Telluribacter sp.]|jgi:peptidoglycan L-alanyl-D-glutamate endopeptidase CwlK|uniref:peptidoglycan-binding protein n=1 Tax=Telluribacter sp. TaxID=1978767 RepID=UPI002E128496|nr:peptidoglycan-binding protein [Telluribacter sp.]